MIIPLNFTFIILLICVREEMDNLKITNRETILNLRTEVCKKPSLFLNANCQQQF